MRFLAGVMAMTLGAALVAGCVRNPFVPAAPGGSPRPAPSAGGAEVGRPSTTLETAPPRAAEPIRPSTEAVVPRAPVPSLEQERQAQAERQAAALGKRLGVAIERVAGAGVPAWWSAATGGGDAALLLGRGSGRTLDLAYEGASRQASNAAAGRGGVRVESLAVARAAYVRPSTGDYLVWVAMRSAGGPDLATRPAAVPPPGPSTGVDAPPAGVPAPVAAASDAPAWWKATSTESGGRVTVGARAQAPTLRQAPRAAVEAARAELRKLVGGEPRDVLTLRSVSQKLADGSYQSFVLVSCAGAIRR